MNFHGFGFQGFRGYTSELVKIAPVSKINLIAGQNNSGKSNIIRFLQHHLTPIHNSLGHSRGDQTGFSELDLPMTTELFDTRIAFPIPLHGDSLDEYLVSKLPEGNQERNRAQLRQLLLSPLLTQDEDFVWFIYRSERPGAPFQLEFDRSAIQGTLSNGEIKDLWQAMTSQTGGSMDVHWVPQILGALNYKPDTVPKVETIPAIREVGAPGTKPDNFSGVGIIDRLARLQNPAALMQSDREKFDQINAFLRTVTQKDSATIEIPYDRDVILVHMDGRSLPLESLGTGIHEVIILASAATILEDAIVCIEEPELHLHPTLQRQLLDYIATNSTNTYFFSTHSGHLLDTRGASIFHVTSSEGGANVHTIKSRSSRWDACQDLGLKASDIVQSNCIIWVEGPSDRIYIKYWLDHIDSTLVEGVHYSIMFFGGRLMSHLAATNETERNEPIEQLISLLELNRWSAIVFDSDRKAPTSKLNATKKRLVKEFKESKGIAWVTNGREIENYLPEADLKSSILAVHKNVKFPNDLSSKYCRSLQVMRGDKEVTADKIKVARHYTSNFSPDFGRLNLKRELSNLIRFVEKANGIE